MKNRSFNINAYDQTLVNKNDTSLLRYSSAGVGSVMGSGMSSSLIVSGSGGIGYSVKQSMSPISRSPPVEIYDFDLLELETSSSSSSLTSSEYNNLVNYNNNNDAASAITYNSCHSSTASAASDNNHNSASKQASPRSSITTSTTSAVTNSSFHSSSGSTSSYGGSDEAFTFQDFISSIINDNDVEWHKLIVQDLARLLELKFREFKKSVAQLNSNKSGTQPKNFITNACISLDTESELFTKIAQKILDMASEEPNGILGTRIRMRIMVEGGQVYDMCQCFAYDSNTMATSEITVTIMEDIRSIKKLLQAFKLYANFSKYVSLHVDSNNFDIIKKRLY